MLETVPGRRTTPEISMDFETAIERLPEGARQVFVLHDVEGYRHEEIAEMLGLATGTSKSQLHRARMALRQHLERWERDMSDQWTDRLSEYLDDELRPRSGRRSRRTSGSASRCGAVLADLRRVVVRARALEDRPPARTCGPGSRRGSAAAVRGTSVLDAVRARRRWSFSLPQLAAAGHRAHGALGRRRVAAPPGDLDGRPRWQPAPPEPGPGLVPSARSRPRAGRSYAPPCADLERVLAQGRGRLDTTTVRVHRTEPRPSTAPSPRLSARWPPTPANVYLNRTWPRPCGASSSCCVRRPRSSPP